MKEEPTKKVNLKQKLSIRLVRRLWVFAVRACIFLLVTLTVYMTAGRLLMPLVEQYKLAITEELSEAFGAEVSIAQIEGGWFRFSPLLSLNQLEIKTAYSASTQTSSTFNLNQPSSHFIEKLALKLDTVESLLRRGLVVEQINIDGLVLELVEHQDSGIWSIAGLAESGNGGVDLLDLVLNIGDLQMSEATLVLYPASGESIRLNNAYLQLQNYGQSHHLQVQARLPEQALPLRFNLEIEGDPRADFTAAAYLKFSEFDFVDLLGAALPKAYDFTQLSTAAELWFERGENAQWQIKGIVNQLNLEGQAKDSELALKFNNGSVAITATQQVGEGQHWQIWLQDPLFDFHVWPWESGNFLLQINQLEEVVDLKVMAEQLDLAMLNNMLSSVAIPTVLQTSLEQIHPAGFLENISFKTRLKAGAIDYPNGFELSANLNQVSAGAWNEAPSGSGINGYLQANQVSGLVELDSNDFTIELPKVFNDSWHYDFANARVHWYVTNEVVKVNSSVIDVGNEGIHGRVQFDLLNERNEKGRWNSELSILVGALEMDASQKSLYLPTLSKIQDTMAWVDDALVSGDVKNSGFVYRGITGGEVVGSSTVETFYHVDNGVLNFLPEWPPLEDISAFILVHDNDADVSANSASISGIQLGQTFATIRPNSTNQTEADNSLNKGSWLSVQGKSQTSMALGLDFIRQSPVSEFVGDYINNWQAEGSIEVAINLGVPISNNTLDNSIEVHVNTQNNRLVMPDYSFSFEGINGQVAYQSNVGLSSDSLTSQLFGSTVMTKIEPIVFNGSETLGSGTGTVVGTRILSSGLASSRELQNWPKQSKLVGNILSLSEGELDYTSELKIYKQAQSNGRLADLSITSTLSNVAINLPRPFNKPLGDAQPLQVNLDFLPTGETYHLEFGENIVANLLLENNELIGGQVQFSSLNTGLLETEAINFQSKLFITGELDYFNFDEWLALSPIFFGESESASSFEEGALNIDVDIKHLDVFGMALENINTQINRINQAWQIDLDNQVLAGQLNYFDEPNKPLEVALKYLRFPELIEPEINLVSTSEDSETPAEAAEAKNVDLLGDIDPNLLPDFNFSTEEFSLGAGNLGQWSFELRTNGSGASISNFMMTAPDARITDSSNEAGANLDWHFSDGFHTTSFNGVIQTGDLAEVLPSWGYGANIQSDNAEFVSNLQWSGSPAAFSILQSSGQIEVLINSGRFVDINSDSARLFAAFNFDTVVRRLQLDFSDLYRRGLAYDKISGKINLDNGIVNTDGRFLIQGPSSTINIEGELDLINEMINADMLVNIPLSQNISVIAGILGAWPVAVGTYVAGKIFKDQLADFTTILYHLEGPWSELDAGFVNDNERVKNEMEEVGVSP